MKVIDAHIMAQDGNKKPEIVDTFRKMPEDFVEHCRREYQLAFGCQWTVWIKEIKPERIRSSGLRMAWKVVRSVLYGLQLALSLVTLLPLMPFAVKHSKMILKRKGKGSVAVPPKWYCSIRDFLQRGSP